MHEKPQALEKTSMTCICFRASLRADSGTDGGGDGTDGIQSGEAE